MKFRKYLVEVSIGVCLLCAAASAHAVSIEVSRLISAWNNVVIDSPNTLDGEGTNKIMWGLPINEGDHSAFLFDNTSASAGQVNSPFSLGQFTYFNKLVTGETPESAELHLDAAFDIGGTSVSANNLDVQFRLHQIPGQCGRPNCSRDLVKLKNTEGIATFVVDGAAYTLNILGFMTDDGLKTVLHSFDDSESRVELVGEFTVTAIPEPGTLGLALFGFAVLLVCRRRRMRVTHPYR